MLAYYKSRTEITREFGVSEGAVRNWIRKAIDGKLSLQLIELNNTQYILKNSHNFNLIHLLVAKGQKFRPNESRLTVTVPDEVYNILDETQIHALMADLKANKNISFKFAYLGDGSKNWHTLMRQYDYGCNQKDAYLLKQSLNLILDHYNDDTVFNIIDIGCGTAEPIFQFLTDLKSAGKLNSYTALDISESILKLNKEVITAAFPTVPYDNIVADFETRSLQRKIFQNSYLGNTKTINLALCLGGTLYNYEDYIISLYHIRDALSPLDKLIISNPFLGNDLDNYSFDNYLGSDFKKFINWFPSLLGFNEENCSEIQGYNEKTGFREYHIVMNRDVELCFEKYQTNILFKKYDKIRFCLGRKDTFEHIQNTAKLAGLKSSWIIKHPSSNSVMYMLGKV
ncbi:MAG: L-histidine N(alpha)-methyltransferase [Candidatus Parcubacteria bacterium]|nr:L-histidine N(alpha)-methyltransferase [Candidatus Paceibacterota bacterium]